jgi:hypothetical protein
MHCHGSLQLGIKIPESLVCSMRWRGVDNAPADADPALASLAAPPAGVARTVAQELWGVRRNPSAYSTHPSGLGTLGPWSDIIKEFGFVLPKTHGIFSITS